MDVDILDQPTMRTREFIIWSLATGAQMEVLFLVVTLFQEGLSSRVGMSSLVGPILLGVLVVAFGWLFQVAVRRFSQPKAVALVLGALLVGSVLLAGVFMMLNTVPGEFSKVWMLAIAAFLANLAFRVHEVWPRQRTRSEPDLAENPNATKNPSAREHPVSEEKKRTWSALRNFIIMCFAFAIIFYEATTENSSTFVMALWGIILIQTLVALVCDIKRLRS